MQEHPVPQNVTGYEFHLIGQMTLKQFMEVAGGIIAAVLVNLTNLPEIIKYPIMVIFGLTGVALAFIPLEGRPLDRWFFAFIKSIYQPTMFFWKKTDTTPNVFTYTQPTNVDTSPQVDYKPLRESRVKEFLTSLPTNTAPAETAAKDEDMLKADSLMTLFSDNPPPLPTPTPTVQASVQNNQSQGVTVASQQPQPVSIASTQNLPPPLPPPSAQLQRSQSTTVFEDIASATAKPILASPVETRTDLPFPAKPTVPNKIVGMVISTDQKILDGAIVTVLRQQDGTPVRALKTNTLGQFEVVTALENGSYVIEVEKEGFSFEPHSLELKGNVLDPILLQSK